jgi:hypothetical protein
MLVLGAERSWAGPPDPTSSDSLFNTAGGTAALSQNTTGQYNTAFGGKALSNNATGDYNTAVGGQALLHNITGRDNTANGGNALYSNTAGGSNTAFGVDALGSNTIANSNTAIGAEALFSNTEGANNTANGGNALYSNTIGSDNTAIGNNALANLLWGDHNTAVGSQALSSYGYGNDSNIAVGFQAGSNLVNGIDNIYLGNPGHQEEYGTMYLGDQARTASAYIYGVKGNAGAYPASGTPVLIDAYNQLVVPVSSARYKSDIAPMGTHSRGLLQLRPVTFRYKKDTQRERQYGLIAEEVTKIYPELVTRNAAGEVESVRYHELIPMLLNEVQQQQRQLASLKATVKQLQERDSVMTARLERLEVAASQTTTLASR